MIFAYHGYPWLIHRLTYRRTNHDNFHVRGYKEEGTTTTPFDMTVLNQLDRFDLAMDVIDRVPRLQSTSGSAREALKNKLIEHRIYVRTHGEDMPEIRGVAVGARARTAGRDRGGGAGGSGGMSGAQPCGTRPCDRSITCCATARAQLQARSRSPCSSGPATSAT